MRKIKTNHSLVFLSMVVILFSTPLLSYAKTAREIAQKSFPSVVMLLMEDANGQPLSIGSGFFVREGIVATTFHVIEGAAKGYAKIVGQKPKYGIAGTVGIDEERDLILLSIKGAKTPALSLGDCRQVAVGDEVYVVGNPQGLEGTFSQGIISSIRQIGSETIFQITAPISPGSSGGPVLNSKGEVIGVAVATFKGGQNLNFAIPVSYLVTLLSEMKPISHLAGEMKTKQKKSIIDEFGGRGVEGVIGGQLSFGSYTVPVGYLKYTFSLRNQLYRSIKDVYCLVIFYDRSGNPIDFDLVLYSGVIPAGLAKRVESKIHDSIKDFTTDKYTSTPSTKVEFRILDFKIID